MTILNGALDFCSLPGRWARKLDDEERGLQMHLPNKLRKQADGMGVLWSKRPMELDFVVAQNHSLDQVFVVNRLRVSATVSWNHRSRE